MKRYRLMMALTMGMLCFFSMMGADNDTFCYDTIECRIISEDEKTVAVTGLNPDVISIDIPETVVNEDTGEEYTVKVIDSLHSSTRLPTLESVKLPESIIEISRGAFFTTGISEIFIPSKVSKLGALSLYGSPNLKKIDVSPENPYFSSYDGILYNKDMDTLIFCGGAKTDPEYPESVKTIGSNAFSGYVNTTIELPASATSIETEAFAWSFNLTHIQLPGNLTYLGDDVFLCCYKLESVELPASLSELQYDTFSQCGMLRTVICKAVIPPTGAERAFPEWHREGEKLAIGACTLYVPSESLELYKEAEGWKNFGKICAMEETGIDDIKVDNESSSGIYDLHGRRIGSNEDRKSLKALPKGIYIVNGKKIAL